MTEKEFNRELMDAINFAFVLDKVSVSGAFIQHVAVMQARIDNLQAKINAMPMDAIWRYYERAKFPDPDPEDSTHLANLETWLESLRVQP